MKRLSVIVTALMVGLFVGCGPNPETGGNSLKIILEDQDSVASQSLALLNGFASPGFSLFTVPTATSDFNCFTVNVTGAGISGGGDLNCSDSTNFNGRGQGIVSRPAPRGLPIVVEVPSGANRNIDVIGIYPPVSECGAPPNAPGGSKGYFIGGRTTDIAEATSVTIPVSFNSSILGTMTCGGGGSGPTNPFGTGADGAITVSSGNSNTNFSTATMVSPASRTILPSFKVASVSGNTYAVTPGPLSNDFMVGDEVVAVVVGEGPSNACGAGHGIGEAYFSRVVSVSGGNVTVDNPVTYTNVGNTPTAGTAFCAVQLLRVPNFSSMTISTATLTVNPFSYTTYQGGILIFRVNGLLTIGNGDSIGVNGKGYPAIATANFPGSSYTGQASAAQTINNGTGGGGGTVASAHGGGGGGNFSSGGSAATGISGGIGSSCTDCKLMGGAGGTVTAVGGAGGGVIMIYAKNISLGGASTIDASGTVGSAGSTTFGGAGGGAGGYITLTSLDNPASLSFNALGGSGGTGGASNGNGGGGGAGGIIVHNTCAAGAPTLTNTAGTAGAPGGGGTVGNPGTTQSPVVNYSSSQPFCL